MSEFIDAESRDDYIPDIDFYQNLYTHGVIAWNLAILPLIERDEMLNSPIFCLFSKEKMLLIEEMIDRKLKYFSKYNFTIEKYDISFDIYGDLKVTVLFTILDE